MSNEDQMIANCFGAVRNPICRTRRARHGSVYLAVLGTSLIVALLVLSTLALQRIQNRMLTTTADIRQAQLNAEAAIELGLLAMKQDTNWRTTYTSGHWFTNRSLTAGTCSLDAIDPVDNDLTNNTTDPVVLTGIGNSGASEQRVQVTIDPQGRPLSCLRSAIAVGHAITLTNSVLRSSGPVAASSLSASSATVYGNVQGVTVSGSTYAGTSTQISSSQLPKMPTWSTVFDSYKTNGTQLIFANLSTVLPNIAINGGVETTIGSDDWGATGNGTQISSAAALSLPVLGSPRTGSYCLKVSNRPNSSAAATYSIDRFAKQGQSYAITFYVYFQSLNVGRSFQISICTQGTGDATLQTPTPTVITHGNLTTGKQWVQYSTTFTAPAWTGNLATAYVKLVANSDSSDIYVDDLTINEVASGRYIYQKVLGPGVNTLYYPAAAPTNSQGIYWIDCGGQKLTIERSRIKGTLLVINPGAGSCIYGPINWSPAVTGYPALMVHADVAANANFALQATNRVLSETENSDLSVTPNRLVSFNPTGMPFDFGASDPGVQSTDADISDVYPSEIRGLVAVENNLTYSNNGLVRGAVVVGNDLTSTGGTLEVAYQPDSLLNPPPGFNSATVYLRRAASAKKTVSP